MGIKTAGLSHIAIRVTDLARAKRFYTETLGFPLVIEEDRLVIVNADGVYLALDGGAPETRKDDKFNPFRVGLDHLALAVSTKDLDGLKRQLDASGVRNNGIETDPTLGGKYISFHDPDGIALELYALPAS
jgi:glyoxylase I family protein